jgi:uncharacterized RDD family membrane protein YckC
VTAAGSPAGFWKRYVAYFIDVIVLYVAVEAAGMLFFAIVGSGDQARVEAMLQTALVEMSKGQVTSLDPVAMLADLQGMLWRSLAFGTIAYVLLAAPYFVLQEASVHQASLGKRLVGIVVTDGDGHRLTRGRALARFAAASLSWLTLNAGHALAAWTPSKRALHDFLADTRVLDADPAKPNMPVWGWVIVGFHALVFAAICVLAFVVSYMLMTAAAWT